MKKLLPGIFVMTVMTFLFLSGCSDNTTCSEGTDVKMDCEIYSSLSGSDSSVSDLTVRGLDNDSLVYDSTTVSTLELELDPSSEETVFLLSILNDSTDLHDTLTIHHTNKEHYLSLECGCIVTFTISDVSSSGDIIDSIRLINDEITNTESENIRIYLQ